MVVVVISLAVARPLLRLRRYWDDWRWCGGHRAHGWIPAVVILMSLPVAGIFLRLRRYGSDRRCWGGHGAHGRCPCGPCPDVPVACRASSSAPSARGRPALVWWEPCSHADLARESSRRWWPWAAWESRAAGPRAWSQAAHSFSLATGGWVVSSAGSEAWARCASSLRGERAPRAGQSPSSQRRDEWMWMCGNAYSRLSFGRWRRGGQLRLDHDRRRN